MAVASCVSSLLFSFRHSPPPLCLSGGQPGSHLRVSWRPNFLQSTMMKSMIEGGMKSGIRDTYKQFIEVNAWHGRGEQNHALPMIEGSVKMLWP